jgi:hypothetical protein
MEHTLEGYLSRLPKETLEKLLQDYLENKLKEDYSMAIGAVVRELARRNKEEK